MGERFSRLLFLPAVCGLVSAKEPGVASIDFNRDIRPILSDACFTCHGPDKETRKADLRLDTEAGLFAEREGVRAVVPGQPGESELFLRVTADDADDLMPPPKSGEKLTPARTALLRAWIEQGAQWERHWSFVAPGRPAPPKVKDAEACRNPIDFFVRARLEAAGLQASPEADKATLLRRVSLDLTGLPPTPAELDAFLADASPRAYERVVDRLLASPRYGERMAARWLDLARYADTSGYQSDGPRSMWRWRDWVIRAYNDNLPFDRFTLEQLAGDLMQEPTRPGRQGEGGLGLDEDALERLVASGFNRNHRGNAEGGIVPEEFQVEYVVDRVDTTATIWMGLTMGCARCHDHKYDPISMQDFYGVFSYFNNVPEYGRAIKEGNSPPYVKAPTREQRERLRQLEQASRKAQARWSQARHDLQAAQEQWEKAAAEAGAEPRDSTVEDGLVAHFALDAAPQDAGSATDDLPDFVTGRIGNAAKFNGRNTVVNAGDVGDFGYMDKFSLTAWVKAPDNGTLLSRMEPEARASGYSVDLTDGRIGVNLVKRWLDDSIRVESAREINPHQWHHVAVTYDGSRQAAGITIYLNGRPGPLRIHHDFMNITMAVDAPFRIGAGNRSFRGSLDEVRIYNRRLDPEEVQVLAAADSIDAILATPVRRRTPAQTHKLRAHFLAHAAPAKFRALRAKLGATRRELDAFVEGLPTVMVMSELRPRATHVLKRGQYDQPGARVSPGVPAFLPPLPRDAPNNRLGFARWLVSGEHPLTARVTVNRHWQMLFGEGLVRSMEDFGFQGRPPTHPKLLDWLATEFVRNGWDVKALLKTLVLSATYRQTSLAPPDLLEQDPENRLLARGPRFRLSAEMIRDQALAASGLLHEQLGGPSVKPYQPAGLWTEIASDKTYEQARGDDLYRRSLYTYWKRTVAPPTMTTFDATPRETCTVRRTRTNTPMQALALMNDVTYVEAARALAQRMLREDGRDEAERLAHGFRLVLGRSPGKRESAVLGDALRKYQARLARQKQAAARLIAIGESPAPGDLQPVELAAYTLVASLILNLDETVTRQ